MKTRMGLALLALAAITGCASAPRDASAVRDIDFAAYGRAVFIEEVRLAPPVAQDLPDAERAVLASRLRMALVDVLPTPGAAGASAASRLRLEITVTEIDTTRPAVNAVSSALIFVPVDRGGIAFEARYYAGDRQVGLSAERRKGSPFDIKGNFSHYGHAIGALRKWGEGLARAMQET